MCLWGHGGRLEDHVGHLRGWAEPATQEGAAFLPVLVSGQTTKSCCYATFPAVPLSTGSPTLLPVGGASSPPCTAASLAGQGQLTVYSSIPTGWMGPEAWRLMPGTWEVAEKHRSGSRLPRHVRTAVCWAHCATSPGRSFLAQEAEATRRNVGNFEKLGMVSALQPARKGTPKEFVWWSLSEQEEGPLHASRSNTAHVTWPLVQPGPCQAAGLQNSKVIHLCPVNHQVCGNSSRPP